MLHGCLPSTEYFEITGRSEHTYGIWVTTPPGYADAVEALPIVYVVDGNFSVGLTAPLIVTQADPFLSVAPYIQVAIGYVGDEAERWAQVRNRDLVPPGEPVSDEMLEVVAAARKSGAMTQEQADAYLAELADTHADVFLEFLVTELHPRLKAQWRISERGHGLFGYSYGGLFALYAWLRGAAPFASFGAGTPGIASEGSVVFQLLEGMAEAQPDAARLHITLNEAELFGDVPIYRQMAQHVLSVRERLRHGGRSEEVSFSLLHETHVTGLQASFLAYLVACRQR